LSEGFSGQEKGQDTMSEAEAIRERIRKAAQKGREVNTGGGAWINPGAVYRFKVTGAKCFKGYKSDTQGVIEFEVVSMKATMSEEYYKEKNTWPNPVGTTASLACDLSDKYKCRLFMDALSSISHVTVTELLDLVKQSGPDGQAVPEMYTEDVNFVDDDGKPGVHKAGTETGRIAFEELLQVGNSKYPSPLVGIEVQCEAWLKNREGKTAVTKEKWTALPFPKEHPLAGALE